jgi:secondary thiamine-phosphate synthase enzyme
MIQTISITSSSRKEMIPVLNRIQDVVHENGWQDGVLHLFVPHTTAAITINENADRTVPKDLLFSLQKISPIYKEFCHLEGNSDAHVLSSILGCELNVIVQNNQIILGTWQGIFFCEFDGPRSRKIFLRFCKC